MTRYSAHSWRDHAACKGVDTEIFFPHALNKADNEHAKQWCQTCPVQAECDDYALTHDIKWGVWGGLGEVDRTKERRRRQRRESAARTRAAAREAS